MIQQKIVEIALQYEGEREMPRNSGFQSKEFLEKMRATGWREGWAWCAFFAELVWSESYKDSPQLLEEVKRLFSGSAVQTYRNFDASDWKTRDNGKPIMVPQVGALVAWRHGTGWQGHIGVVVEVIDETTFKSIEGNTNDSGGREGVEVAIKTRKTNLPHRDNGLNLLGFVLPKNV